MAVGRLVERGGNHLGVDTALHIGHLLGAFVDEQYHQVHLGMVIGNGVGHLLEEGCLTRLGLGDDKAALPLSDGGEHIDDARGEGLLRVSRQLELLLGEKRCQRLERHTVAYALGREAVDFRYLHHNEVLVVLLGRTHHAANCVARLQAEVVAHLRIDKHIVGRSQIVIVRRAEETESVGSQFQHTLSLDHAFGVEGIHLDRLGRLRGVDADLGKKFVAIRLVEVAVVAVALVAKTKEPVALAVGQYRLDGSHRRLHCGSRTVNNQPSTILFR